MRTFDEDSGNEDRVEILYNTLVSDILSCGGADVKTACAITDLLVERLELLRKFISDHTGRERERCLAEVVD